jgi:hypothetical protein
MRFLLLSCLAISPLVMQEGSACLCFFEQPLCNQLPNPDGPRTIFVGVVVDVFPESVLAYRAAFDYDDRGSVERYKALILRLWGPVLLAGEARRIKLANSRTALRAVSDLGTYPRRVRLRVSEWLKGRVGGEFEIFTDGDDCGYKFEKGKEYLVVSRQNIKTGRWWVFACSRTALVGSVDAQEDLIALRVWRTGRQLAPRIYGRVVDWRERQAADVPATTAVIRLVGASIDRETRTDAEGRFSFDDLTPAKYRVEIVAPAARGDPRELDLSRGGCFEASVFIEHNATGTEYSIAGNSAARAEASPVEVFLEPAPSVLSPINAPLLLFPPPPPPVPVPNPIR